MKKILPLNFYLRDNPVKIAKELIGKYIMTDFGDCVTGGMIVETEAYKAPGDKASHAYNYRRTKRNEAMYLDGGRAYVYICYGIHNLFNIVTNAHDIPHAILIRSLIPEYGIEIMQKRRNQQKIEKLANGPGALSQALGISKEHNAITLDKPPIWIEDLGKKICKKNIEATPRIGIEYAKEDARLPWRFILR